jgi:shikimate kinase
MLNEPADIARLVQSSIAPVFLFSGVAAMLGVLTNRLSRIVDRARAIEAQLIAHPGSTGQLHADLRVLARRARYINLAIALCAISALLIALVVVTLFAVAFLGVSLGPVIALLFVVAMLVLSAAFIAFLMEVRQATAALRIGHPHI